MIAPIVELGDPVLFKKATPVSRILGPDTQSLISTLIETLINEKGLGLAAPQIGISKRLFLMWSNPVKSETIQVFINPVVTYLPGPKYRDIEGCLSIPGLRGRVSRYHAVQVQYYDQHNTRYEAKFTGLEARIIQHEYDHLEGVLFLDRVQSSRDIMTEAYYAL